MRGYDGRHFSVIQGLAVESRFGGRVQVAGEHRGLAQLHSNVTGICFDQPPPETMFLRLGLEPMGLGLELLQEGGPLLELESGALSNTGR